MPRVVFVVTLSISTVAYEDKESAIAQAGRYLAWADQTDFFGYHARIKQVRAIEQPNDREWKTIIRFTAPVVNQDEVDDFVNEMSTLSRVTGVECVKNPMTV